MEVARAVVIELCRRGWRRRGGKRWWERHPPGKLGFGADHEGDELRRYLALDRGEEPPRARTSALCWLGFADRLPWPPPALSYARWVTGVGAVVLDALVDELRARWAVMPRGAEVLDAFLDAAEAAGRRDLGVLVAARAPMARARLAVWLDEARAVRFFDDGYAAAQALLELAT